MLLDQLGSTSDGRIRGFFRWVLLTFCCALSSGGYSAEPGGPLRFTAVDTAGNEHGASEAASPATVWVFIAHDCPICNRYSPELIRLIKDFATEHVPINLVYAESGLTLAALKAHAEEHGYATSLFLDSKGALARACGVTVTPEVAVIDANGTLAYRGRIDDRLVRIGQERTIVTTHDLRAAVASVLAGRPVTPARTTAIGCYLAPTH